jgi:hypothetical protein
VTESGLSASVWGEKIVETIFKDKGYKIVYPETLPVKKQIALMKNCKSLAGISGSALHLSLFADDNIELTCICRSNQPFKGQLIIDKMKNLKSMYIMNKSNILPVMRYAMPYIIGTKNKYFQECCKDNNFKRISNRAEKFTLKNLTDYIAVWVKSVEFWNEVDNKNEEYKKLPDWAKVFSERIVSLVGIEEIEKTANKKAVHSRRKKRFLRFISNFIVIRPLRKYVQRKIL